MKINKVSAFEYGGKLYADEEAAVAAALDGLALLLFDTDKGAITSLLDNREAILDILGRHARLFPSAAHTGVIAKGTPVRVQRGEGFKPILGHVEWYHCKAGTYLVKPAAGSVTRSHWWHRNDLEIIPDTNGTWVIGDEVYHGQRLGKVKSFDCGGDVEVELSDGEVIWCKTSDLDEPDA